MSTNTHRMRSARRLVTAVASLALALTVAPTRLLHGQVPQDTVKRPPWDLPPSPPNEPSQNTGQAAADSAYIREVYAANVLEVRLGTLAGQRAADTAVKQFGRQMVTDHSTMAQQWTSLATRNRLPTSGTLSAIQQQTADRLANLSGAEFDRAYMSEMVSDHRQDAATFQRIAGSARSTEVRQLAAKAVPLIQQHLTRAQQLATQVAATSPVATTPPTPTTAPANPSNAGGRRRTDAGEGRESDGQYAQGLAHGHILEVRLAELAQQRARNKEVKQFANRIADHFGEWQERWTELASRHGGLEVNPNLGPLRREKIDRLEKASNANFDRVYLDIVVEHLGSMVPYLQKEGRAAGSADVRKAVDEELPKVREKLSEAQRLDRQVVSSRQ
jgi:putative membrane protein